MLKKKAIFAVMLFSLAIALLLIVGSENSGADGNGTYPAPTEGDWVVNNTTKVWNETIILNGNLTIEENGNLTLSDNKL